MIESYYLRKTLFISVFIFFSTIFGIVNISAQNFAGNEYIVCGSEIEDFFFKFTNDSVFVKEDITDEYFPLSTYTTSGDTIFWMDVEEGEGCDSNVLGTYTYLESGDSLIFQLISDDCPERFAVLTEAVFKIAIIADLPRLPQQQFKIFPNPVISTFSLETNDQKNYDFQLISNNGQVVFESEISGTGAYNIEWLAKGIYYLNIKDKNNKVISTSKLLKM